VSSHDPRESRSAPHRGAPARVTLGRVVGAHALRGEVRVRVLGDGPENLLAVEEVVLCLDEEDGDARPYTVVGRGSGRPGEVRLGLEGVTDRDAASALRGRLVRVDAEALAPRDPDELYWHELVGCRVVGDDGREIGVVDELWETGAHDVLVVRTETGERHLLPTARELMREVDVPGRRIVVALVPGLLDAPVR